MITAITLENFKGISNAVTIPLRPLTIVFGKNSAGKSTVVQALHYAREIFEHSNLNADRTLLGGSSIDLGGFRNLVNNHDLEKPIRMRFQVDLYGLGMPEEYSGMSFSDAINNVAVEIVIEWSQTLQRPILTSCQTAINNTEAVRYNRTKDNANFDLEFNAAHILLGFDGSAQFDIPNWTTVSVLSVFHELPSKNLFLTIREENQDEADLINSESLTLMLTGAIDVVRWMLEDFRYIGPLRVTLPRNFQPTTTKNEADWSSGLAAWNELYQTGARYSLWDFTNNSEADSKINLWLSSEKLKTGYQIKLKQFREIPLDSPLMFALENNTVFDDIADTGEEIRDYPIKNKLVLIEEKSNLEVAPQDVGVGISQVMPVIVAAVVSNNQMVAIEQPELHLHPAMQAELGDLFIESALGETKNFFLIETHSEHLILRILRRIREQAEGEKEDSTSPDITPTDVQLIYIESSKDETIFYELPVTKEGDFAENVPGGFFAERAKELF